MCAAPGAAVLSNALSHTAGWWPGRGRCQRPLLEGSRLTAFVCAGCWRRLVLLPAACLPRRRRALPRASVIDLSPRRSRTCAARAWCGRLLFAPHDRRARRRTRGRCSLLGMWPRLRADAPDHGSFELRRGNVDRLEQSAGQQARQLARVTRVGLDPVTGSLRHQPRRHHRAVDPALDEMSVQRVTVIDSLMVGDLRMWLYRATPGNPRQMRRRRPISPTNRTPPPARLRLRPV
jgi:hypothetical protein